MATPTYEEKLTTQGTAYSQKYPAFPDTAVTWDEDNNTWDDEGRTWDDIGRAKTNYSEKYT
jgi:hypothetical protein